MNCKAVEKRLTEDVRTAAEASLQQHLAQCRGCRELYRQLLSLGELSGTLKSKVEVPADFAARVLERSVETRPWAYYGKPALAVVVLVVFSGGFLGTDLPPGGAGAAPAATVAEDRQQGLVAESGTVVFEVSESTGPYVDVLLDHPADQGRVLRLPSRIEIRKSALHHDSYLQHVSY